MSLISTVLLKFIFLHSPVAPPTINSNVLDVTLPHPGGVVKFPLNISGDPQPTVTWEKFDVSGSSWAISGSSALSR